MLRRCLVVLAVYCVLDPVCLGSQTTAPAPCDRFRAAVEADPKNLGAAVSLGLCTLEDEEMVAPGGDSSRLAFRSSWGTALRALRHAVEIDPTYDGAYRPLFYMLFADTRDGCSRSTGKCLHVAPILREGDSVLTPPRLVRSSPGGGSPYEGVVRETRASSQANIAEARALAERWASAAPNDRRPHEYLGRAFLRQGDPAAAANELELAAALGDAASRRELFWYRLEALVKSGRGVDARRVLDEAVNDPGRDTSALRAYTVAGLNELLGRNRPPPVDSARMRQMDSIRMRANRMRIDSMSRTLQSNPPARRGFSALLADGDTLEARRQLAQLDSTLARMSGGNSLPRVTAMHLGSATNHLALADTAPKPDWRRSSKPSTTVTSGSASRLATAPGWETRGCSRAIWPRRIVDSPRRRACTAAS